MKSNCGLYPEIGKFFPSMFAIETECRISRSRLWRCFNGKQEFTEKEKKGIARTIIANGVLSGNEEQVKQGLKAFKDFDGYFKKGV